jgi:hypothetical protein
MTTIIENLQALNADYCNRDLLTLWHEGKFIMVDLNDIKSVSREDIAYYRSFKAPVNAPRSYYRKYDDIQEAIISCITSGELVLLTLDDVKGVNAPYSKPSAPWNEY